MWTSGKEFQTGCLLTSYELKDGDSLSINCKSFGPQKERILGFLWRAHPQKLAHITFKSGPKVYPRRNPFFIHTKTHQQRLPVVIEIVQTIMSYIHRFIFKSAKLQTKLCFLNINQNKTWTLIFSNVGSEFCLFSCVSLLWFIVVMTHGKLQREPISLFHF